MSKQVEKSLIVIIADNKKGMLAKITKFFVDHDMNIESLTLSSADIENKIHRTTVYISGDRKNVNKLCKEIEKIEGVRKVYNFMADKFLERELGLIKVKVSNPAMSQITALVNEHNGETIYVDQKIMVCQVEEIEENIDKFMEKVKKLTDKVEISRTGIVATSLDDKIIDYNKYYGK